jgi:hypothetical protein
MIIAFGLILALAASHEKRIERSKNSWRGAFLTSDVEEWHQEVMVPEDKSELTGSFHGDGELGLEVRRIMPEIPHLHRDNTVKFWGKLVSGRFRVNLPNQGNYRLIARSPRTSLPPKVVQDPTKVLEKYEVMSHNHPRVRISIDRSEIDLVEFLERHFEPLRGNGLRQDLLRNLHNHCKDWSSSPGYIAKWDQLYPGLFEDLGRTLKNVAVSPSVVGKLTYQINHVTKPYD